ncbi:MAG: hypothetical protein AAGG81_06125, partial [Chlamydiota bacterium]
TNKTMKRKLFLVLIYLFCSVNFHADAYSNIMGQKLENGQPLAGKFSSFSSSLYRAVAAIESLPEATKLIDEVQKEGAIAIEAQYFHDSEFEALWDSENRIIYVNISRNNTLGKKISSILFELHNAKTNKNLVTIFKQAQSGLIDKDSYVESIERLEHSNALSTSQLIEKGIATSLFPEDTRWDIFSNFEDHYKVQQIYGHSQWIADRFDSLCPPPRRKPYKGTIKGLEKMSILEKNKIVRLLVLKSQMRSDDPLQAQRSYDQIQKEFNKNNKIYQAAFGRSKNA